MMAREASNSDGVAEQVNPTELLSECEEYE